MTLFQWRIYTLFPLHRCWLTDGCVACQQRFGIVLFFSELLDFHHLASAPPTMIVMATYDDHDVVWLRSGAARRGLDTVEEPFCFPRLGSQVKTLNNFIYFYYLHSNTKVRRDNNGCLRWEARKIMSPTKTMCTCTENVARFADFAVDDGDQVEWHIYICISLLFWWDVTCDCCTFFATGTILLAASSLIMLLNAM